MQPTKPAINSLTGLRFIAALVVFVHHLNNKFGFGVNPHSIGSLAVSFFFVLSGFVLVYAYHDRLNHQQQVKTFLFNRWARIWPLHFACLAIAIFSFRGLGAFASGDTWWRFLANVLLLQSWFSHDNWVFAFNGVSWSISTEAFFYLLFPVLLFASGKRLKKSLIVLGLAVFGVVIGLSICNSKELIADYNFFRVGQVNPWLRLPDFLIGIVAGWIYLKRQDQQQRPHQFWIDSVHELMILSLIYATVLWVTHQRIQQQIVHSSWGSLFLGSWFRVEYPVGLFGIAVYVFAKSKGLVSRIVANRLFVYLGKISYAFYLIHHQVIRSVYVAHDSYGTLSPIAIASLCFVVSLGAAILLHEWIERPIQSALLSWYRQNSDRDLRSHSHKSLLTKTFLATAMFGLPFWFLTNFAIAYKRPPEINAIVRNSAAELRNIEFGGQMRLLGVDFVKKRKRLEIRFAWLKRTVMEHRRLVQIVDNDGKQIARGQHNQDAVGQALPGQSFVDVAYVRLDQMQDDREVVVRFRDKVRPSLFINKGRRRMGNRVLVLLNAKELSKFD